MKSTTSFLTQLASATLFLFSLLSLLSYPVRCQDNFLAIPNGTAEQYRFNFARDVYARPEPVRTSLPGIDEEWLQRSPGCLA